MYKKHSQGWLKHLDFIILDILCLQIAFLAAYFIRHGLVSPYRTYVYRNVTLVLVLIDIAALFFFGTLKNVLKRGYYKEFSITFKHTCLVELLLVLYLFVTQGAQEYSRSVFILTGGFYLSLTYPVRVIWKKLLTKRRANRGTRSLLIVTTKKRAAKCISHLQDKNYEPVSIAGIAVIDADMTGSDIEGIPVVANMETVLEYVCREWIDEVFINVPDGEVQIEDLTEQFTVMGVVIHTKLARIPSSSAAHQIVENFGQYTVLTTSINFATPAQLFVKRSLDIAGGLVGTVITGILFLFLAPAIYLKSPGPIFFSQIRVGKNGRKFKIYKFRSMYMDAEERKKELMAENRIKDGMMFKLEWDPRIIGSKRLPDGTTKKGIGNIIRDLSLDEFPQFINVLKGDMSLVGTRPPTVDEWEKYELHHRARLAMKPGVTGMWQVSGRSNITDFEEVVKLDTKYISEWNMGMDFRILLKTLAVVFKREGSM